MSLLSINLELCFSKSTKFNSMWIAKALAHTNTYPIWAISDLASRPDYVLVSEVNYVKASAREDSIINFLESDEWFVVIVHRFNPNRSINARAASRCSGVVSANSFSCDLLSFTCGWCLGTV